MRVGRWIVGVALMLAAALPAAAHLTPNSEVRLEFRPSDIAADIVIPKGDFALASGLATTNDPAALAAARAWLRANIAVVAPDGRRWLLVFDRTAFETIAGPPDLHVNARLVPPAGAPVARLTIGWRAVTAQIRRHFVLFLATAGDGRPPAVLGAVQGDRLQLAIDRGQGVGAGFAGALRLGMAHIAQGSDHLLFLLALLLPAPVLAAGGRWGPGRKQAATLRQLALLVTAFTLGHSLTLVVSAALHWQLPPAPVEILIAVSILVTAFHAWRPIFAGREAAVAAGFGLVHGLAFATLVGNAGLGVQERGLAILGFNLGIEIVQMIVVVAVLPWLLLLARAPNFALFRTSGAGFAGIAAFAWLAERITGSANAVASGYGVILAHPLALLAVLAAVALANHWAQQGRRGPPVKGLA